MSVGHLRRDLPAPRSAHLLDRQTERIDAAFSTFLWPLLGIVFLPFATLIYLLLSTPGRGLRGEA